MKISRDTNGNVSYTLETNDSDVNQIIEYWTPKRKEEAIPIMQVDSSLYDKFGQGDATATDPAKADLTKMPFSAGGKLFFSHNGKNYVASANILKKNNLLITAAHCVQDKDTGELYSNFYFERCYNSGKFTEKLTFKTVALKEYWRTEKAWKWDYAMAILNETSSATPLDYSINDISGKNITAYGYPTNYYNGKNMVYVTGPVTKCSDNTWILDGCKMRNGSSGGGWVMDDNKTLVGVNSFIPASTDYTYEGTPMLDDNFESLYNYVISL